MTDHTTPNERREAGDGATSVDRLAHRALLKVASAGKLSLPEQRRANIAALSDAAINGDRDTCVAVVQSLIKGGIPPELIADDYIPSVARQMGDAWCTDDMSFATVTIGVSRLQSLLRELGPEWRSDSNANPDGAATLIVVALDEYHTLGAMVLAGRLRRAGLSVKVQVGVDPTELRRHLQIPRYDAILISASVGEDLETLRLLVEAVRTSASSDTPVVVGGSIAEGEKDIIQARTGADLVTSDAGEALEHCGLRTPIQIDAPSAPGT